MITNLGYEEEVPQVLNEFVVGLISQNLKVVIDAYILGTLFHYLVKKDPEEEASQELMRALKVYCDERDLPTSLHEKMQDYLRFQQQHSTGVTDHVIRVRFVLKYNVAVLLSHGADCPASSLGNHALHLCTAIASAFFKSSFKDVCKLACMLCSCFLLPCRQGWRRSIAVKLSAEICTSLPAVMCSSDCAS